MCNKSSHVKVLLLKRLYIIIYLFIHVIGKCLFSRCMTMTPTHAIAAKYISNIDRKRRSHRARSHCFRTPPLQFCTCTLPLVSASDALAAAAAVANPTPNRVFLGF